MADPRGLVHDFGLDLRHDIEVRVDAITAGTRYNLVPLAHAGTENSSAADLEELITRAIMIDVMNALPSTPQPS